MNYFLNENHYKMYAGRFTGRTLQKQNTNNLSFNIFFDRDKCSGIENDSMGQKTILRDKNDITERKTISRTKNESSKTGRVCRPQCPLLGTPLGITRHCYYVIQLPFCLKSPSWFKP